MDSHPTSCFKAPSPITWCPMESSPRRQLHLLFDSFHHPHHQKLTHTRRAGGRAVGQAGRAAECIDAHEKLFKYRGDDLPESEVSSLTRSLSLDAQDPTECCVYVTQHGHCLVDTTSDWSFQNDVCTVHSGDHLPVQHQIMDGQPRRHAA